MSGCPDADGFHECEVLNLSYTAGKILDGDPNQVPSSPRTTGRRNFIDHIIVRVLGSGQLIQDPKIEWHFVLEVAVFRVRGRIQIDIFRVWYT